MIENIVFASDAFRNRGRVMSWLFAWNIRRRGFGAS
jgi:hypothetical protein